MACSTKPGPAAYRTYIEKMTGQRVTQQEWHDLRALAALEGRDVSRARVAPEEAVYCAALLGGNLRLEYGQNPDTVEQQQEAFDELADKLNGTNVTVGTSSIIRYMSEHGVKNSLELARTYRKNGGTLTPVAGTKPGSVAEGMENWKVSRRERALKETAAAVTGEWGQFESGKEIGIEREFSIGGARAYAAVTDTEDGYVAQVQVAQNYGRDEGWVVEHEEAKRFDTVEEGRDWVDAYEVESERVYEEERLAQIRMFENGEAPF